MSGRAGAEAGPRLSWPESRRLGPRVRDLRVQAGTQVQELAPQVGLSANTLSGLERAHHRWRRADAERAAAALGTNLAELLRDGAE